MTFFRNLLLLLFAFSLAASPGHAQDDKKEKKRNRKNKNKTEQNERPDQEIRDGEPVLSKRELETSESMFVEGMKFFMLEDYTRALEVFEKSISINPRNAAAHFKVAEIHVNRGNAKAALPHAQKALELDNKNQYYYLMLAQVYSAQKQFDEAVKVYNRLIKDVPGTEEFLLQLAEIYMIQNKFEDALKAYERLEKTVGVYDELIFRKQQIYLRLNQLDKALAEGNKLIENYPDEPRYLLAQAQLLASNNKPEEAYKLLDRAVKLDPENPYAQMLLADLLMQQGKEKEANDQIKAAFRNTSLDIDTKVQLMVKQMSRMNDPQARTFTLELAEITKKAHPTEAKAFAVSGDLLAMSGQKKEARDNYLKAIKLDNSHFQIWQQVILIDAEMQQNDSLLTHTEKALELFPNQSVFWFYNGTAYMLKNNHTKAVRALEQGRKLSGDNPELQAQFSAQLGDAYNSLKDYVRSDAAYEDVLKFDSNNDHVLNNYAYFLSLRNENLEKAKTMSQKLVQRHPQDETYLDTHAWVLYQMKDYEGARKFLEQASVNTKSGTIVEHYGDVLWQLGQKDLALQQWQKAKSLGSASNLIDKKIKDKKLYE